MKEKKIHKVKEILREGKKTKYKTYCGCIVSADRVEHDNKEVTCERCIRWSQ